MQPQHQFDLDLIPHEENGSVIHQRAADGYINATAMCKVVGKEWSGYARNPSTKEFLDELAAVLQISRTELVHTIQGGTPTLQGTWVHPQVAIHLASWLSPKFAVKVTTWVHDWLSGKGAPKAAPVVPYHIERHMANLHKIPPTSFSILQEMSVTLIGPLEAHGYSLPEQMVPDISQGRMFCGFLRKNHLADPSKLATYRHAFPDGREVDAKLYPIELLPAFRRFIAEVWMPERSEDYFKERDVAALPYLQKVLRLEAPANSSPFKRIA